MIKLTKEQIYLLHRELIDAHGGSDEQCKKWAELYR